LPLCPPQVVGLPTINNIACKLQKLVPVQTLYHVYARFRIFVVFKDFENFRRANCLFAPQVVGLPTISSTTLHVNCKSWFQCRTYTVPIPSS